MKVHGSILAMLFILVSTCRFCHSVFRSSCQVLEEKYYKLFNDLRLDGFEDLEFSIAAVCDDVRDLHKALKEVPLDTDWLCFPHYKGGTIEQKAFSQFTGLKSLYIVGDVDFLSGAFSGLSQLQTLWIESLRKNIFFHEGTFYGLTSLQELKISNVPLSSSNLSILSHLNSLDHLILRDNNMIYLSEVTRSLGIFQNLQKLSVIGNDINELRDEDCLKKVHGGYEEFNVSYLDLSENPLNFIQDDALCNFQQLKVFKAERSGIIMANMFESGIKKVQTIALSYDGYGSFEICNYSAHFQAEEIQLAFNTLNQISTSIGSCEHLKMLDLSLNGIRQVLVGQIYKLYNLIELDLSGNNIDNFNICANESFPLMKLVNLNVSYNHILGLQEGQFACLQDLQVLSLENNRINRIEESAFDGLDKLRVLNLQSNALFEIEDFTFRNLFSLRNLNLFENVMQDHYHKGFWDLVNLQEIHLTYQEILGVAPFSYLPSSLRHISIKAKLVNLEDIFLNEFPFFECLEIESPRILIGCEKFSQAKELHLKNVVFFKCAGTLWNPFLNFTKLEKLYYTGNKKETADYSLNNTLKYHPLLTFLSLQDTDKMVKDDYLNVYNMFEGLSNLEVLHLKNSGIERWDSKEITKDFNQLEFLFIENQKIEDIKVTIFDSMPNLKYIYFLETTFPCSCEFSELLSWLESGTSVSIINFHTQECRLNQNSINLISFLRRSCQNKWDFILFISSFLFTLLFMCTSLFYESIWWYLLYIIYTVKCWLNHRKRDMAQYDYDVFVSYNARDEWWVVEKLLPNLERNGPPFFKACIHNRDFEIGKDIVDNIMDSIFKSRWTICVITRNFLQSSWCSLEMRMATYRLLQESKDSIILIFLDRVSREELQYYHALTKLLDSKTYLDWPEDENGQQLFWARLRNALANSGRKFE